MECSHPDDDPTLPPPGTRNGKGVLSVLPFLKRALAAKPQSPQLSDFLETPAATAPGDLEDHPR